MYSTEHVFIEMSNDFELHGEVRLETEQVKSSKSDP